MRGMMKYENVRIWNDLTTTHELSY